MELPPDLFTLPEHIETRWATPENPRGEKGGGARTSKARKGRPSIPVQAGERIVLAEATGTSGIVRRMWLTLDYPPSPAVLRGMRIDIFWDGAATPAVSAPLGDFFGQGLGRQQAFASVFFSNPEGRSFNCAVPMPFRTGFKIVVTNESSVALEMLFYGVNYTLGDPFEGSSYLHAHWHRESPTVSGRDFEILPTVSGRGRYLGANFSVITDRENYLDLWWGEGECKIFLDGDGEYPTLVGTGTEDYIGTAWGQGQYAHPYQGCPLADADNGLYAFYRYHVPDPVYFQREIRVTIQQIGGGLSAHIRKLGERGMHLTLAGPDAGGPVNMDPPEKYAAIFERTDDWASCCYFYLDKPENGLPPLAPLVARIGGLCADKDSRYSGVGYQGNL